MQEVFGKGKQFSCRGAKLFVLKNNVHYNRICFTFSRKFGNAVVRNHARRLGREAFRLMKPRLCGGHDLVFLVYPPLSKEQSGKSKTDSSERVRQLESLFIKAGLLK
ncbi:MAG: ribonuclease P protein component [Spirochaetes bacterium]|nr:ribonuclease P protein component [Spirochaetota bacterium]